MAAAAQHQGGDETQGQASTKEEEARAAEALMISADDSEAIAAGEALSNGIRPLLRGHKPEVVGMALGDLAAILFAGHHPTIRKDALER